MPYIYVDGANEAVEIDQNQTHSAWTVGWIRAQIEGRTVNINPRYVRAWSEEKLDED